MCEWTKFERDNAQYEGYNVESEYDDAQFRLYTLYHVLAVLDRHTINCSLHIGIFKLDFVITDLVLGEARGTYGSNDLIPID